MDSNIKQLNALYNIKSKHSSYQKIHPSVAILIENELVTQGKNEDQRQKYLTQHINFENKTVLEIGCNTGYFTIASVMNGAKKVDAYEGNNAHCEFLRIASKALSIHEKINVYNEYFDPSYPPDKKHDICIFFNVLHHLGDDFQNTSQNIDQAKEQMKTYLNLLSRHTDTLILQMGFNWKGDNNNPLFRKGEKKNMISFIKETTGKYFYIDNISCPKDEKAVYLDFSNENNNTERDDTLGEFLNRPIFILRTR